MLTFLTYMFQVQSFVCARSLWS